MDADLIKRLKGWFYLRLSAEDWTRFGSSAAQVLQTFDHEPDQEDAFLRFATAVILLEGQTKFPEAPTDPAIEAQAIEFMEQRISELEALGISRQQLRRAYKR